MYMLSCFSCVQLFAIFQAPLSMGFSRQESWTGLPCPPPGDLFNPGIECLSLTISCIRRWVLYHWGFPCGSAGKESACSEGDLGSIPGLGRYSGEGHGNPLQDSCLENPMDRGA